ncbi:MAG TPA: alpha-L-fucosidase [Pedobacter sp.]|nr:alpha-L-fucosidase [Pedobacter sp.]
MNEMWGNSTAVTKTSDDAKYKLFDKGNYAMFIHFGMYSQLGGKWDGKTYYGISEWLMNNNVANIPVKEYMEQAKNFNPAKFDGRAIAKLAKNAGMKYIVVTAKHHDGFAMYDSKVSDFNVVKQTPFARDPIKELAQACRDEGLGFGFYYSHNQDWTFPGGNGGPQINENGEKVGFDYYFKHKCLPQVEEITTKYGPLCLIWFDTPGNMPEKYVKELIAVVRKNQPNALVSGRAGHGFGDYETFGDMEVPLKRKDGYWETVDVTNDSWGYAWYDEHWKSSKTILTNLISTVARGGTYMLNIGPSPDGTVNPVANEVLTQSGEFIKRYPQVIYDAKPSPWLIEQPWGDATVQGKKLNLCIYNWPENNQLNLYGLKNKITKANIWHNGKKKPVVFNKDGNWTKISLPIQKPEKWISVIELELDGIPAVEEGLGVDRQLALNLNVILGKAVNCAVDKKEWMEKFGEWKHIYQAKQWKPNSELSWEVNFKTAGLYSFELNYTGKGRMAWRITVDDQSFIQNQQNSSNIYQYFPMGVLKIDRPGKHKISVSLIEGSFEEASLKSIKIGAFE